MKTATPLPKTGSPFSFNRTATVDAEFARIQVYTEFLQLRLSGKNQTVLASKVEPPSKYTSSYGQSPSRAWMFLASAIASEVIGLTVLRATITSGYLVGHIVLYASIALSYFFLSKAVKTISVGAAYAIWEGSGIALITLVSAAIFHHILTVREMAGIAMSLAGVLMVNAGEVHEDPARISIESNTKPNSKGTSSDE